MRVWIVETGEQIAGVDGDVRNWHCGMLAKALADSGHEVVLWASTFHHLTKRHRFDSAQRRVLAPRLQVELFARTRLPQQCIAEARAAQSNYR